MYLDGSFWWFEPYWNIICFLLHGDILHKGKGLLNPSHLVQEVISNINFREGLGHRGLYRRFCPCSMTSELVGMSRVQLKFLTKLPCQISESRWGFFFLETRFFSPVRFSKIWYEPISLLGLWSTIFCGSFPDAPGFERGREKGEVPRGETILERAVQPVISSAPCYLHEYPGLR